MDHSKTSKTSEQMFAAVARIASILGSVARMRILYILAQAPRSVEAIAGIIGESIANTSQHLQKLLREGLVSAKKDKLSKVYRLSDPSVALLIEKLFDLAEKISPVFAQIELRRNAYGIGKTKTLPSVLADLESGRAIMLDVRDEYEANHSPVEGAILIPLKVLNNNSRQLDKSKTYYLFCRGRACDLAVQGVTILRSLGFQAFRLRESPALIQELQGHTGAQ